MSTDKKIVRYIFLIGILSASLVFFNIYSNGFGQGEVKIIKEVNFNNHQDGENYDGLNVAEDFGTYKSWGTYWPFSRVKVVSRGDKENKAIRVKYPKGKVRTKDSGAVWQYTNFGMYQDLFFSYWVKFSDDFDFRAGGKMHGLCGGGCNTGGSKPTGHDGWSVRLHWGLEGKIKIYIYHKDQNRDYGDTFFLTSEVRSKLYEPGIKLARGEEEALKLITGRWYFIQMRVFVNDTGHRNGFIQAWLDGKSVLDIFGFEFRDSKCADDELLINTMYFCTFFGGNDDRYKPRKNEYAYFDDLRLTTGLYCPDAMQCDPVVHHIFLKTPQSKLFSGNIPGSGNQYGYGIALEWIIPKALRPQFYEIQYSIDPNRAPESWKIYTDKRPADHGPWINHHGNIQHNNYTQCLPGGKTYYYRVRAQDKNGKPITGWSNVVTGTVEKYM